MTTIVILAVAVACAAAGCAPSPAPSPSLSSTGFASDAEAFAAAEATYRTYVDALNQVDLADPTTFEPVFRLTTGEAKEAASEEFDSLRGRGLTVGGDTRITLLHVDETSARHSVRLLVCADVSEVTLTDTLGQSAVSPDRPAVQPLSIMVDTDVQGARISSISGRAGAPSCG